VGESAGVEVQAARETSGVIPVEEWRIIIRRAQNAVVVIGEAAEQVRILRKVIVQLSQVFGVAERGAVVAVESLELGLLEDHGVLKVLFGVLDISEEEQLILDDGATDIAAWLIPLVRNRLAARERGKSNPLIAEEVVPLSVQAVIPESRWLKYSRLWCQRFRR
jgi:hypothetical protein